MGPRLFRAALGAFPRAFRHRFGPSMEADFAEGLDEARKRGRATALATTIRSVVALVAAGLAERVRPAAGRTAHPHPGPAPHKGAHPMELLSQDLRFAVRSLVRRPAFTLVAVFTLALGIGANTAIFSVVDGVLLEPLDYNDPDGLLVLWQHDVDRPTGRGVLSLPNIQDVEALDALETMVGYRGGSTTLTGMGEAELIAVGRLTQGLMSTFRVRPALGRDIEAADNVPDAAPVVVISHGFWQERFGGDPAVLGRTLHLRGETHQVVGVAPAGFDFPDGARAWYALRMDPEDCARGCNTLEAIGRLAGGATLEGARAELDALALRLEQDYPDSNHQQRFRVLPLARDMTADVRKGLWLVLGAVGVVLLIACANVANLLLVRGAGRRSEVAVRAALGASRRRLGSQVILESGLLAVAGGLLGLALASGALGLLRALSAGAIPRIEQVGLDGSVLAFTAATVVVVTVLFGLSPAAHVARAPVARVLSRAGGRGRTRGGEARSRSLLLAGEVALSVVLLVGAGLLLRTFAEMYRVDLGYETREVLRFTLVLEQSEYGELEQVAGFYRQLEERIAALPGVASVGSIFGAPLGSSGAIGAVEVEGRPEPEPGQETYAALRPVTPGYLETLRIPILRGRGIEASDVEGSVPVVVINERVARESFPGQDPLGQRMGISVSLGFGSPTYTVVGVVPDIRSHGITREPTPEAYVSHAQVGAGFQTVTVRGRSGVEGLAGSLRELVREMDPNLPLRRVETLTEAVSRQVAPTRFYLTLVAAFAGLALVLASVGLYGVVSYLVSQRTGEIGVRMALGAGRTGIVRLVVIEGLRPAVWGVVLGLAASLAGARAVESLLYGVPARDPWVFTGVPLLLLAVVVMASLLPARKASRVDPVLALRAE